jgi:hypothetical protein
MTNGATGTEMINQKNKYFNIVGCRYTQHCDYKKSQRFSQVHIQSAYAQKDVASKYMTSMD